MCTRFWLGILRSFFCRSRNDANDADKERLLIIELVNALLMLFTSPLPRGPIFALIMSVLDLLPLSMCLLPQHRSDKGTTDRNCVGAI